MELTLRDAECGRLSLSWQINLAELYGRRGEFEQAADLIEEVYRQDPDFKDGYARLGSIKAENKDWESAYMFLKNDQKRGRISSHYVTRKQEIRFFRILSRPIDTLNLETGVAEVSFSGMRRMPRSRACDLNKFDDSIIGIPDYVRLSTVDLIAGFVEDLDPSAAVAEVGVYKGHFASYLNSVFKNRKIFLFDTFTGFSINDLATEDKYSFSKINSELFSDTTIDVVMKKMRYPKNVVLVKGYFPVSAKSIIQDFVFVSIDVDLYKPTFSSIEYFYPLIIKGGYLMIHDYHNYNYRGVKKAVDDFCNTKAIYPIPLSDFFGSVLIQKTT